MASVIIPAYNFYTGSEQTMKRSYFSTAVNRFVSTRHEVLRCAVRSSCSLFILVTSSVVLFPVLVTAKETLQQRIYKGFQDRNNEYPFVLALLRKAKVRICTGTLISPTWVLSSAHCRSGSHVQYGDLTLPRENITSLSAILKYLVHPSYRSYYYFKKLKNYNDIAMVMVEFIPTEHGRLSGLDYKTLIGLEVMYLGLGVSNMTSKNTYDNKEPRQVAFGVVSSCTDVARVIFQFPRICVASHCTHRQSAFPGDAGGPLLNDNKIIGITIGILHSPKITIFTPISPYLSWIRKNLMQ